MKFKERLKKVKLFLNIEKELQVGSLQLEEIQQKITENKNELKEVEEEVGKKKTKLQLLKTEIIELKDFINSKFKEDFKDCDYKVNIAQCYIISLNGKKYISLRSSDTRRCDFYTIATGFYNVATYRYYDALTLDEDGKYKYLHEYRHGYCDNRCARFENIVNEKPDYEVHILEIYPELRTFVDDYVPNTYLKKIYYEVNDLGEKRMIKNANIKMN